MKQILAPLKEHTPFILSVINSPDISSTDTPLPPDDGTMYAMLKTFLAKAQASPDIDTSTSLFGSYNDARFGVVAAAVQQLEEKNIPIAEKAMVVSEKIRLYAQRDHERPLVRATAQKTFCMERIKDVNALSERTHLQLRKTASALGVDDSSQFIKHLQTFSTEEDVCAHIETLATSSLVQHLTSSVHMARSLILPLLDLHKAVSQCEGESFPSLRASVEQTTLPSSAGAAITLHRTLLSELKFLKVPPPFLTMTPPDIPGL